MGKAELRIAIDADLPAQARASGRSIAELIADGLKAAPASNGDSRARQWAEDNAS